MKCSIKSELCGCKYKIFSDGDGYTAVSEDLEIACHENSLYTLCHTLFSKMQESENACEQVSNLNVNEYMLKLLKAFSKAD